MTTSRIMTQAYNLGRGLLTHDLRLLKQSDAFIDLGARERSKRITGYFRNDEAETGL